MGRSSKSAGNSLWLGTRLSKGAGVGRHSRGAEPRDAPRRGGASEQRGGAAGPGAARWAVQTCPDPPPISGSWGGATPASAGCPSPARRSQRPREAFKHLVATGVRRGGGERLALQPAAPRPRAPRPQPPPLAFSLYPRTRFRAETTCLTPASVSLSSNRGSHSVVSETDHIKRLGGGEAWRELTEAPQRHR